jgi:serine/threonine protein kinase
MPSTEGQLVLSGQKADVRRSRPPGEARASFATSSSMVAESPPQAPERYGKYHLLERIGIGGMAEVWRAKTLGSEGFTKDLVIKRILPKFTGDEDSVRMFIDEARLVAKLHHPNIVQIFDFDKEGDRYYLAMELVEGRDLRLSEKAAAKTGIWFPLSMSIYIISEALKGLQYAHSRLDHGKPLGIVHRDISPHNILISFSGDVKIGDFGIAKVAERQSPQTGGTVKGKLSYMSPEQITGQLLDARSDIYSMGIVFWELLTRHRLFFGSDEQDVVRRVRDGVVPPPRQYNPDIPEEVEKIVLAMLVPNRATRIQTAGEAVKQLMALPQYAYEAQALGEFMATLFPEQSRNWTQLLQNMLKSDHKQPIGKSMLTMTPLPSSIPNPFPSSAPVQIVPPGPPAPPTGTPGPSNSKPPLPLGKRPQTKKPLPPAPEAQSHETAQLRPEQLAEQLAEQAAPKPPSSTVGSDGAPPLSTPATNQLASRSPMSGSDQKTQIATELPPEVAAAIARGAPPAPAGARTVMAPAPTLPPPGAPPSAAPPMSAGAAPEGARTMIAQAPSIPGPPGGAPVVSTSPQQATMYASPAPSLPPPQSMAATLPPGARNAMPLTMRPSAVAFGSTAPSVGFPPVAKWIIGPAIALIIGLLTTALANRIWPPENGVIGGPSLLAPSRKLKIITDPAGATVELNGKALESKTPTDIKGDVGSTARIKIMLDGFDPVEMRVLFAKDERPPLNIRMPKLGSTKAKSTDPSQFDTKVGVQEARRQREAHQAGQGRKQTQTAKADAKADKTDKTAKADAKTDKTAKADKADGEEEDKKGKKGKKDKADKADKTAAKKDKPTITITVRPYAVVYIDGKKIQQTPLRDFAISPGPHTILLVNDIKGKRESIKVKVTAGEKLPPITRSWE